MNLRDYFALEAMNGLIKRLDLDKATNSHLAFLAYNIADEMLDERLKYK
jgi:hypothetical protein